MVRTIGILLLLALLGACDKGVKPAATPTVTTPPATTGQTIDQTPDLETHPLALYEQTSRILPEMTTPESEGITKQYFERLNQPLVKEGSGFSATANHTCPIMQKMKLNATTAVEHTVVFEGKVVGFCCADCVDAWATMSDDERRGMLTTVLNKN